MSERWRSGVPLAGVLLGIAATAAGYQWLPQTRFMAPPWTFLGLLPLAAAALLIGGGLLTLRRHRTTIEPAGTPTTLVRAGAFARSRNPIYLGHVCFLLGLGLLFPSAAVLVVPPAYFLLVDRLVVPFEEARLEREFGEDYRAYCRTVPRWL